MVRGGGVALVGLQDIWYTLLSLQYLGREGGWGGGLAGGPGPGEKMVVQQTLNLY